MLTAEKKTIYEKAMAEYIKGEPVLALVKKYGVCQSSLRQYFRANDAAKKKREAQKEAARCAQRLEAFGAVRLERTRRAGAIYARKQQEPEGEMITAGKIQDFRRSVRPGELFRVMMDMQEEGMRTRVKKPVTIRILSNRAPFVALAIDVETGRTCTPTWLDVYQGERVQG